MKKQLAIRAASAVALVLLASTAFAADIKPVIDTLLSSPNLSGAAISVRVVEVPSGKVLYSFHADDTVATASNAKVVTTAAALDLLGPDFELTTTLVARGEVRDSVLYGDLILIGKGDPSISTHWNGGDSMAPLRRFAQETVADGVRSVTGDIIVDDSYFDGEYWCPSWPSNQWIHWYMAPVAALAFNDNCIDATVSPGKGSGAPAIVAYYPRTDYVRVTNLIKTTSARSPSYGFYRDKDSNDVTAKGSVSARASAVTTNFTVHDPALFLAAGLRRALEEAGISVAGTVRRLSESERPSLQGLTVVAVNRITVAEVVKYCNLNSQNLYAEMLFKTLGREVVGEGSFEGGGRAVGKYLEKLGVYPGTYCAADGSGLSKETRYSAKVMTEVLRSMYAHRGVAAFRDSLPLAGYNGTMSDRLTDERYRGRVRAKTGYIFGASSLSGYVRTANDKTLAFSILMNRPKGLPNRAVAKPIQDNICKALIDSAP